MNKQTLIGSKVRIAEAKNKSLLRIDGRVVDETKNTFILETNKGLKKIIKKQVKIEIEKNYKK